MNPGRPLALGISSCLLGEEVRHDGGHKKHHWIVHTLGRFVEFRPVCPEMGIGLGVPRPRIRLTGKVNGPRIVGTGDPALDVTETLAAFGRQQAEALDDISGYIFKNRSPSCGVWHVPVWQEGNTPPIKDGRGS